jgi:hypothetical protein
MVEYAKRAESAPQPVQQAVLPIHFGLNTQSFQRISRGDTCNPGA